MAKSAIEKVRDTKKQVKIVEQMPEGISWAPAGSSMVVSTPREVDAFMQEIPKGSLQTSDDLRDKIAKKHGTSIACPLSTGIFINISAKAAEESLAMGASLDEVTPYWRTLKSGGELNPKFPGGIEGHAKRLEAEGYTLIKKTKKKWLVETA